MINQQTLIGRIFTKLDITESKSDNGKEYKKCNFMLSITSNQKDKNGEWKNVFIPCITWNNTVDYLKDKYVQGALYVITGRFENPYNGFTKEDDENRFIKNTYLKLVVTDIRCLNATKKEKTKDTDDVEISDEDFEQFLEIENLKIEKE